MLFNKSLPTFKNVSSNSDDSFDAFDDYLSVFVFVQPKGNTLYVSIYQYVYYYNILTYAI